MKGYKKCAAKTEVHSVTPVNSEVTLLHYFLRSIYIVFK